MSVLEEDRTINKDVFKALQSPLYAANNNELLECVVKLELIAKIDPPKSDKSLKQKLSLEMLQNKFSVSIISNNRIKDLLIQFINNLQSKKTNSEENKLWKRVNDALVKVADQLP